MQKKIYEGKPEGLYSEDGRLDKFLMGNRGCFLLASVTHERVTPLELPDRCVVYHLDPYHVTASVGYYSRSKTVATTIITLYGEEQQISEVERIIKEEAEKFKPKSIEATVGR